ncbi:MAG: DUF2845 domain-containing protein [Pseudomonadales bacterium]|jgi:hypothetical protein|nr:DUF2845 domain-containing protein [Pseudomonadales bacterium]
MVIRARRSRARRSRRLGSALVLLAWLLSPAALALRCPGGLVDTGAHKSEVLSACGEPVSREQILIHPRRAIRSGLPGETEGLDLPLLVEEWVYEFGPQRFRRLLRFSNARLTLIETLDKPR